MKILSKILVTFLTNAIYASLINLKPNQTIKKTVNSPHDPNYVYIEIQPAAKNYSIDLRKKLQLSIIVNKDGKGKQVTLDIKAKRYVTILSNGDDFVLNFENLHDKSISLTYAFYEKLAVVKGTSYYVEYFDLDAPFLEVLIPKNSYSFFYTCNNKHDYEARKEVSVVGNVDLGYGNQVFIDYGKKEDTYKVKVIPFKKMGSFLLQVSGSMAQFNGLDTNAYGLSNGGVVNHNPMRKFFIFGPAMSINAKMIRNKDNIEYFRYDGAANSTWDFFNHAYCGIYSPKVITSETGPSVKESYELKNKSQDEWLVIRAILTTNESKAPTIGLNYEPVLLASEITLQGPSDNVNLNIIVLILVIVFVAMILLLSVLVMKLVKFGRKGEEFDEELPQDSTKRDKN